MDPDYLFRIKEEIALIQVPCLLVGFQNNTISTFSISTHTFFHNTSSEDCSHLLKNQLFHLVSNGTLFKDNHFKQDFIHSQVKTSNEELPFDIIHQMINDKEDDTSIILFLLLYRRFMTPIQLLQQLINHFENDFMHQERIIHILTTWLTSYWSDFHHFSTRHLLQNFLDCLSDPFYETIEALIYREPPEEDPDSLWAFHEESVKSKSKTDSGYYEESFVNLPFPIRKSISTQAYKRVVSPSPVTTNKRYSTPDCCPKEFSVTQLIRIPVKTMAEQLSLLESELFCKIEPRDFLRHVWVHQRLRETPISASIQHFNHISEWIASMIISQMEIEQRAVVYEYCLKIAVELEQLNNFNSLMAVLAGVNSAAILRLKKTRQRVADFNQGLVDTVSRLEKLMSSERSFYNYRYVLKQKANTPGIPYL
ncbi:unnamed protein product [Rhizopus stolonifer]